MKTTYIANFSQNDRTESVSDTIHVPEDLVFRDSFRDVLHLCMIVMRSSPLESSV